MAAIPTRYVFVTTRDLITSRVHHSAYLSRVSRPRKLYSRVLRIEINQYTDYAGKPWVSRCQMTLCHECRKIYLTIRTFIGTSRQLQLKEGGDRSEQILRAS